MEAPRAPDGNRQWVAQCLSCGKLLICSSRTSCLNQTCIGCTAGGRTWGRPSDAILSRGKETTCTTWYVQHKRNGIMRSGEYLTREEWWEVVSKPCYYCGEIEIRNKYKNVKSRLKIQKYKEYYDVQMNGVDRRDNTKGYTPENSISCCKNCNLMKRCMSEDEFIKHCERIVNYYKNK